MKSKIVLNIVPETAQDCPFNRGSRCQLITVTHWKTGEIETLGGCHSLNGLNQFDFNKCPFCTVNA